MRAVTQIERIAQTEPVELAAPEGLARTVRQASRGVQTCLRACAAFVRERRLHAPAADAHEPSRDEADGASEHGLRHAFDDEPPAEDCLPPRRDEEQEEAAPPRDWR